MVYGSRFTVHCSWLSVIALACVGCLFAGEAKTATGMVTYVGDGTGSWPADCTPPVQWNEYKLKWVPKPGRPNWDTKGVREADAPVNLVWKTDLVMSCHGGMILAGGKLLLMRDRGGPHFACGEPPDFLGAELVALDPADGKVLWRHDCNHLEKIPAGERAKVEQGIKDWTTWHPRFRKAYNAWRNKGIFGIIGVNKPVAKHKATDEQRQRFKEASEAFAKEAPGIPTDLDAFIAAHNERKHKWNLNRVTHNYAGPWQEIAAKCGVDAPLKTYEDLLRKNGYAEGTWYGGYSRCGTAFPTPTYDGERIYVQTGYNDAYAVDLDGKRVWCAWFGANSAQYGKFLASPVVSGDALLLVGGSNANKAEPNNWLRCLDKATGEQRWIVDHPAHSYSNLSPVPLSLPIGDTGKTVDVVWTTVGIVYRVSDGKVLAKDLGCHGNGRGVSYDPARRIIVMTNGSAAGGHGHPLGYEEGLLAIRLSAKSADEVTAELLWNRGKGNEGGTILGDHVYHFRKGGHNQELLVAVDLLTGKEVGTVTIKDHTAKPSHYLVGAGGRYLFSLEKRRGYCEVFDVQDPSKPIAHPPNLLGTGNGWTQGSNVTASGNRLFIRDDTAVYCLGDKGQPLRLSEAHQ